MNDIGPSERVTEKYSFFPTIELVRDLRTIGWIPYAVEQRLAYTGYTRLDPNSEEYKKRVEAAEDRRNYTKHMIVFRNPEIEEVDNLIPEIILTNSHDGRNSFQFFAGVFHTIKESSFVVYEESLEEFRIKHQGYTLEQVKAVVDKVVEAVPLVYEAVGVMKKVVLNKKQKVAFAFEAIRLRWLEMPKKSVHFDEVIKPIREDEKDDTLWNLFQIVQEKIINGGIKYNVPTKKINKKGESIRHQTARALVNIDQKIEIKKSLWRIASQLAMAVKRKPKQESTEHEVAAA
jgi:hypothetical protein